MCSFILFHSLSIIYTRKYSCFLSENLQLFLALAEDFCQFYKLPITVVSWPVHSTVSQDLGRAVTEAEVGTQDPGVALYFPNDEPGATGAEVARGASRQVVHLPRRDVRAHGVSTRGPQERDGPFLPMLCIVTARRRAQPGGSLVVPLGPAPRVGGLCCSPTPGRCAHTHLPRTLSTCQRRGGPGALHPRSHPPPR